VSTKTEKKMSKVKSYTDKELLARVRFMPSFKEIPKDYWILGVQSSEDTFDDFDDKFYLFKGEEFIMVTDGTTNAGKEGLMNYTKYNKDGVAVIKTNEWFYNLWSFGLHKGKMQALRQVNNIKYFRDADKDHKAEQSGIMHTGIIYANFHTVSYEKKVGYVGKVIGGWSVACQVINSVEDYYKIIELTRKQKFVSYCLLAEF